MCRAVPSPIPSHELLFCGATAFSIPSFCALAGIHLVREAHELVLRKIPLRSACVFPFPSFSRGSGGAVVDRMDSRGDKEKPNVAIFPTIGMGHLIPFVELAKRLAIHHEFSITFITGSSHASARQIAYQESLAGSGLDIRTLELPPVNLQEETKAMKGVTLKSKIMEKSRDPLERLLRNLMNSSSVSPIRAFITDMFSTAAMEVTAKLGLPTYIFVTSSASAVNMMLHLPTVVSEMGLVSFRDVHVPVKIPGLPPIPATDLPQIVQDRADSEGYDYYLQHCFLLRRANGILINTFRDLESRSINALLEGEILPGERMPSIYPIGPLISSPPSESEEVSMDGAGCLKWLDRQPASSVIFVSFGSEANLSAPQVAELALGLEASAQRFLWVLRPNLANSDISELLPPGFESRIEDRGLLVASWAPQISVLSHPSTGGFLSHCGWNSTLESICFGVPIIAWPIQAEQRLNRFFLVNEAKVAIEIKMGRDGIVGKEEVERAVRELMEGEKGTEISTRMRELKEKAENAMAEGGSSYTSLAEAASAWKAQHFPGVPVTD